MVSFGKKSKVESASSQTTMSSIPVPPADSALVIDLPEGQKLVLGKMEDGTVIEVATWRGTGRPDSRTNRLMLGVSSGITPSTSSEEATSGEEDATLAIRIRHILIRSSKRLLEMVMNSWQDILRRKEGRRSSRPDDGLQEKRISTLPLQKVSADVGDFQFDKWLQSLDQDFSEHSNESPPASETKVLRDRISGRGKTRAVPRPGRKSSGKRSSKGKK